MDHVQVLVELVDGCREELARLSVDCDLGLFLGFGSENGQGGCVLLADVAELGLDIVLDLYPPGAAGRPVKSVFNWRRFSMVSSRQLAA